MYSGVWVLFATAHDGNAGGMTPAWVHVHGRPATTRRARRRRDRRGVDRAPRRTATSTGERGEGGAGPMPASLCRC